MADKELNMKSMAVPALKKELERIGINMDIPRTLRLFHFVENTIFKGITEKDYLVMFTMRKQTLKGKSYIYMGSVMNGLKVYVYFNVNPVDWV